MMRILSLLLLVFAAACAEMTCELPSPDDSRAQAAAALEAEAPMAQPDRRGAIARELGTLGAPAVPCAMRLAAHPDADVRITGLEALRLTAEPGPDTAPFLAKALADRDPRVRAVAARGLEAQGERASVALPELEAALQDETYEVRYHAARAMAAAGWRAWDHEAAILHAGRHDLDRRVRDAAMEAHETVRIAWIEHTKGIRMR